MPILAPWAGRALWVPSSATWVLPTNTWGQYLNSLVTQPTNHALQSVAVKPAAHSLPTPDSNQQTNASARTEPAQMARLGAPRPDRFQAPVVSYTQTAAIDTAPPASRTRYYLPLSDFVWMIYGAVCLAFLLRLAYGLGGAIGLWQSAQPIYLDSHISAGLSLRSSHKITSPVTVGSAVVLPADYGEWDAEKLRIVLAHERSHVRQGDFYLQALAGLYTAVFWFSPLGWWLKRKLSDLSEAISDHAGLEEAASHASYARILLEFAALPRRVQVGVAMAHTGRLSQRIERLLNESSFHQAFAGGRRRLLAALVLVPLSLFAATALIRVQAAQTEQKPVSDQGPVVGQSHPEKAPDVAPELQQGSAVQAPANPQSPPVPAGPPAPATLGSPVIAPAPPSTPALAVLADDGDDDQDQTDTTTTVNQCNGRSSTRSFSRSSSRNGYSYYSSDDGDSYAVVSGKDQNAHFSGDWHNGEIEKARAMAHGDFLWFTRDGKSYVVDDPQTVAQIQAMYKPMEDLGRQQQALGEKQRELGEKQRELGQQQRLASIPAPDISREMTELNASINKLQSQKNDMTIQDLAELQSKIGQLQGKLGGLQGRIGARQGELGQQQGELGRRQGELGRQQGELGREQGRIAREADIKVKSIIDQSLKDGKARPVK